MTDLLTQARSKRITSGKENWGLNEILLLLQRKKDKISNKAIAAELGRTVHGVGYQFRRAKKFDSITSIYAHHGVDFVSNEEVETRINEFAATLESSAS